MSDDYENLENISDSNSLNNDNSTINSSNNNGNTFSPDITINNWFNSKEYIVFANELTAAKTSTMIISKECQETKRLLDLKYDDLNNKVNNIQTSVIFVSTISGFLQATKEHFGIAENIIAVTGITISTYITLVLSISKYYKLDDLKEKIQVLREKYSILHNKLEHRLDILGPWNNKKLWIQQDPVKKFLEWKETIKEIDEEYNFIIETKQSITTEFETIMDTKSRNRYDIYNKQLNFNNRQQLFNWQMKEIDLEENMQKVLDSKKNIMKKRPSIMLSHENNNNNWDDDSIVN
tara:strand:+ start:8103 stop:8981 length:879 start_codon:yes stop_codon:yes gene_type:complete